MKFFATFRPAALALAAAAIVASPAARAQWTQDGYDAARTYANTAESVLSSGNVAKLVLQWQRQLGQFYASVATQADGRLLVCSNLHGVSAQAPESGDFLWEQHKGRAGNCGSPAQEGGAAFLASAGQNPDRNLLTAINAASGRVRWKASLPHGPKYLNLNFGPAVQDGRVHVSTSRDAVIALSAHDGKTLWRAGTGGKVLNNDVAVGKSGVFVSTWHACCDIGPRQLFAFEAATGDLLWKKNVDASNMQYAAMVLGERVFVGNDNGWVSAFKASGGKLQWSRQLTGYSSAPLVGHSQTVFALAGNRTLYSLDARSGKVLWSHTVEDGSFATSNLAWANDLIYVVTQDAANQHRLLILDARNGDEAASLPLPISGSFTKLSVSDGRVLLSTDGSVLALGLPNP